MLHSYSVDYPRWKIHIAIGVIAVFVGGLIEFGLTTYIGVNPRGMSPFALGVGLYLLFDRWLWRLPPGNWIHSVPDLAGTWEGEIASSHGSEDGEDGLVPIDPDGSRLTITQRWSKIEIDYRNPESSRSWSISARIETETAEPKVTYVYDNMPEGDGIDSPKPPHGGTAVLYFQNTGGKELRGQYYTDQEGGQTYGKMRFEHVGT